MGTWNTGEEGRLGRRDDPDDVMKRVNVRARTPDLPPRPDDAVALHRRAVIERVLPEVDAGRFPVKRTPGEAVVVTADIFADGHDQLAAVVRYRDTHNGRATGTPWHEAPMTLVDNDRWEGRFEVETIGRWQYTIDAWVDRFASWQVELSKKSGAGQDVTSELVEGAMLIRRTADAILPAAGRGRKKADAGSADAKAWLLEQADFLAGAQDQSVRVAAALDTGFGARMREHDPRVGLVSYGRVLEVVVEPERARFGAWYEMFPRSAGPDPTRSATFDEAATRLPAIADLGFDVVYLPPIHPIGRSFRKGPNNVLVAGPDDPGSPWAIGAAEGGHKAVEPGLGTLEDFDRFVATARRLGLEVALDIAFQASPDHPYVGEHPEWFRHRPDGMIKYAENPPKKYQDIYPFDFESEDAPALWEELKSIFLFWIGHGVTIFRVDNPHTKPFGFWEWVIAEVKRRHPETIFLSEAFTRPKVMRRLAKVGFSQSYTYFTWRNTKAELTDYLTELCQTDVREYLRPNLFANTPDILHAYLQEGGRPAFMIRFVLAATLGASYGIYSGFELAENRAVPGTEEYVDSEKYQIRQWDWDQPGHIKELIAHLNRVRHEHPALQSTWSLRFAATDNDDLLAYAKRTDNRSDILLIVVNLDPSHVQHGWIQAPVWDWGLPSEASYDMVDLLSGERYTWRGEWNYVQLDPSHWPAHVLAVVTP
jgi:starch synthase (maltosyl-transferring)